MKKGLLILLSLMLCFGLMACGKDGNSVDEDDVSAVDENSNNTDDDNIEGTDDEETNDENVTDEDDSTDDASGENVDDDKTSDENKDDEIDMNSGLPRSILNGFPYEQSELDKRIICVSIDNHPKARPQAGLSLAEIVYEFEVEGTYTRYMGIFQTEGPDRIGPVRSARPYIVQSALTYDSLFCHCGGSNDAFKMISDLAVANIDGLYTNSYWRYYDTGKTAPHNLYTTIAMLRDYAKRAKYRDTSDYTGYLFNDKDTKLSESVSEADTVEIIYNAENTTKYVYEKDLKKYGRYKDGELDYDENTGVQLFAKNIVIIETHKEVLDEEGRLSLTVVGNGNGYYITDDNIISITWKKTSDKSDLKFYNDSDELVLNPGSTWIQVISQSSDVKVDGEIVNE